MTSEKRQTRGPLAATVAVLAFGLLWLSSPNYAEDVDNGGHFAAFEVPQLFAEELRAAFRSLRQ